MGMGFVQAGMLAAAAAVILPVLAHLFFRRRSRPVDLGTLRFLKIAVRHDTRRRQLKRWVLLALRIGCVAALAVLFARPYWAEPTTGGDTGLTVVLIDRSASMGRTLDGERLVDRAVRQLPDVLARAPGRSRVEVAWFDAKVEPTDGPAVAPKELASGTDYAAALMWAMARCEAARGSGPLAVHVLTDLQRTGFGDAGGAAFPKDVAVRVWDIGPAATSNVGVTEARPLSALVRADTPGVVQATVFNGGAERIDRRPVHLRLANQGKTIAVAAVASPSAGGSTAVGFETPPLSPGLWQGTVSLAGGDALPIDDARHVALYAAARPRVLVLDGAARDVAALRETYFLEAALRLAPPGEAVPDEPFRVSVLPFGPDVRLPDLRDVDVLAVANVPTFSAAAAADVKAFLARGGSAVVFGGDALRPDGSASYAAAGLSVGEVVGPQAARDVPFRVADFAEAHPVLAPFADPQHGDLRRLTFSGCTRVTPADGVKVLARFRDGTPLLLERSSRVLWWTASVGREHGEWSRSRLFLPLVHQLVRGAAGLAGAGPVRELPAAGDAPGVRRHADVWEVRNLEPQESELEPCSPDEFARRLGVTLATDAAQPATTAAADDGLELRVGELWPWLWLMLMVCWLAEGVLADRTVA